MKRFQRSSNMPNGPLSPFSGNWDYDAAAHLLRRSTFGASHQEVEEALALGLEGTVLQLLRDTTLPQPPININFPNDPHVPIGSSWIDKPFSYSVNTLNYRLSSLRSWLINNLLSEGISLREKMTFFWQTHFGCRLVKDPVFMYKFNHLLRDNALKNYKDLIKKVTISPHMLVALDGFLSIASNPNENYAREFLELYTIGKGQQVAPGDYTTFTEKDVRALTKIFTGWRVQGFLTPRENIPVLALFVPENHDKTEKELSARFQYEYIPNKAQDEYAHLIDVIFKQPEVARFICRKLYRFFVYHDIDAEIEQSIIDPLAQMLIDTDFEIIPVISTLLSSNHFFSEGIRGALIKSPLEFAISIVKQLSVEMPAKAEQLERATDFIYILLPGMGLDYLNPPTVAGWEAYFKAPSFDRLWINSATLQVRNNFAYNLSISYFDLDDFQLEAKPLELLALCEKPDQPLSVIYHLSQMLLAHPLSEIQANDVQGILLRGWSEAQWAVSINQYQEQPNDPVRQNPIKTRLKFALYKLLSLAQFHLK